MRAIIPHDIYELPLPPELEPVVQPHPLEAVAMQLMERDAQTRAIVTEVVAALLGDAVSAIKSALSGVGQNQDKVLEAVQQVAKTLDSPVKPVYDKQGKLVGARRVAKLGD
ncbi:MAG: hypothetical protein NT123_25655 [Proteobacteria bacterium]|nr:hypothetical protein [Pseudomonadota bacterium]